jgi:hypothetical protein
MSIRQASTAHKTRAQELLGEQFHIVTDDMERIRTSGVLDHALKVGEFAPEFTLPDAYTGSLS